MPRHADPRNEFGRRATERWREGLRTAAAPEACHVDTALAALIDLYLVKDALARTNEAPDKALQRLRDLLEAHKAADGVLFDSNAWIITALRG
jgi:hypothetical protein